MSTISHLYVPRRRGRGQGGKRKIRNNREKGMIEKRRATRRNDHRTEKDGDKKRSR